MSSIRSITLAAAAAIAFAWMAPAGAQWAWRDASGRLVFSDTAPPKSVPAKDIVRQPAAPPAPRYVPTPEGAASGGADGNKPAGEAPKAPAKPAVQTLADRELESRRRQQQLAEAQKKTADEEARKAQLADNCARARSYQRALEDGHRIARLNAAGEREVLDDAARASELTRTRGQIEQFCK